MDEANGRNFAIICDEAHSSQTGSSAQKLKTALADVREVLKEYAEIEGIAEDKVDPQDKLVKELIAHGKHKNLSFFAFLTATPKDTTLEMLDSRQKTAASILSIFTACIRLLRKASSSMCCRTT